MKLHHHLFDEILRRIEWNGLITRFHSASSKSLYIIAGQIIGMLSGVASTLLLSHWAAKDDYSSYALFVSIASLGLISHGGLINFTSRFWTRNIEKRSELWAFVGKSFWRFTLPLVVIILVAVAFLANQHLTLLWVPLTLLAVVSTLGAVRLSLNTATLNSAEQYKRLFFLNTLSSILRFVGPISMAIAFRGSFLSLAFGFAASAAMIYAACAWGFPPAPRHPATAQPDPNWVAQLRAYGRPFIWIGVGGWLLQFGDRWTVSFFFDPARVADFSYASQLVGFLPAMLAAWLLQLTYPGFFRHVDTHGSSTDWRTLSRRSDVLLVSFLVITLIGTFTLQAIAHLLVGSLISDAYRASLPLILPAAMATTALQANQFHYLILQSSLNSGAIMRSILWVSLAKTLVVAIAASFSWEVLQIVWLASPIFVGLLGRFLVLRSLFVTPPPFAKFHP